MNDGGMLRGTIVESEPGRYVVISLPTGETRRVAWREVRYAGPAARAPHPAAAPLWSPPATPASVSMATLPPESAGFRVRFVSPQDGISFHRVTDTTTTVDLPLPRRPYRPEEPLTVDGKNLPFGSTFASTRPSGSAMHPAN